MKKLWISQIDQTFNADEDLVLGPWCFQGAEDFAPENWFRSNFNKFFYSPKELVDASKKSVAFFECFIEEYAMRLNRKHGVSYSTAFWRHVTTYWLVNLVQMLDVKYHCIKKFVEEYRDLNLSIKLCASHVDVGLTAPHDLLKNAVLPDFDYWFLSEIIRKIELPPSWSISEDKNFKPKFLRSKKQNELFFEAPNSLISNFKLPIKKCILTFLNRSRCGSVYGLTWQQRLIISSILYLKPAKITEKSCLWQSLAGDKYEKHSYDKNFQDIFHLMVQSTTPRSLGEDFKEYNSKALIRSFKKGKIRLRSPDAHNEIEKLVSAHAIEKGERVVFSQHGSFYGSMGCIGPTQLSEFGAYGFITWGWNKYENFKSLFIPLSSPMLSRKIEKKENVSDDIIFVNNKTYTRSTKMEGQLMPNQVLVDRIFKHKFLCSLKSSPLSKILYRPHVYNHKGIDDVNYLKNIIPDLRIFEDLNAEERILNCRLLVSNHYGTTLYIALAHNRPIILLWQKEIMGNFTEEFRNSFVSLKNAKLLFHDPVDAAMHVNKIYGNVANWWQTKLVQEARKNWVDTYARTNKNYFYEWCASLWRM